MQLRTPKLDPEVAAARRAMARRSSSGFTLLEVLIAVAILAMALTSMMGSQVNSMNATRYARDISAAALLAEYQLIELEFEHREEGWVNSDVEVDGDFGDHGYPDIEYFCTVHFIELPEYNELVNAKEGADEAAGEDDNVMDAGDQAMAGLGMVWSMVKVAIENSIRKAECTVTWKQGKIPQEFTIETFWTDPAGLQAGANAGGGEYTDEDDPSGQNEPGGGSGRGGSRPPQPPSLGGGGAGSMKGGG